MTISRDEAEALAMRGLTYLAGDADRLARFVALTGVGPDTMRERIAETSFLMGVLDHFLGDEAMLVDFTASIEAEPELVAEARRALSRERNGDE
jgi:hypothetical protein